MARGFSPAIAAFAAIVVAQGFPPAIAAAQAPVPTERVTFDEAIRRAVEKQSFRGVAAASGILRAEALMMEARAGTQLQLAGT